jgi:hypothetical protein
VVVLFAVLGSLTELAMVGVLVIVVPTVVAPDEVVALTFTTSGKLTTAPTASVWPELSVQVMVPVPPTAIVGVQVHPVGAVKADAKVVFVGIVSVKVTVVVAEAVMAVGPLFVTDCAYVMLLPGVTGFGVPVLVTARSACPEVATSMEAVAKLFAVFGSGVESAM